MPPWGEKPRHTADMLPAARRLACDVSQGDGRFASILADAAFRTNGGSCCSGHPLW